MRTILILTIFSISLSCKQVRPTSCTDHFDETIFLINVENLTRTEIANVVDYFSTKKTKALGINLVFEGDKDGDSILYNSLLKIDNIVLACVYNTSLNRVVKSPFKAIRHGIINYAGNSKKEIDSYYYTTEVNDTTYSSFCYELLKLAYPKYNDTYANDLKYYDINYIGNLLCFYNREHDHLNEFNDSYWEDKIVILGYLGNDILMDGYAIDKIDSYKSPLSKTKEIYGTVILGNILATMKINASLKD